MRPTLGDGWRSEVVASGFFLSTHGRTDPAAEWQASVKAFNDVHHGSLDTDPRCLFPARLRVIERLTGKHFAPATCPELDRWRSDLDARAVTVIHAAQYIKNPASLFGHLFLRFDVAEPGHNLLRLDTLAHTAGFFAQMPPDVGPFDYAVKGIGGGFRGHFMFSSYARALVEYNQMEDRDLWEYELELTPDEISQLTNHLWEMQRFGAFGYYFVRENCAYQVLALLEAAVPRWTLTERFRVYVIPSDSVRALEDVGAIRKVRYRPSLGTNLRHALQKLSQVQQHLLWNLVDGRISATTLTDAAVLSAAVDLLDYRTHQAKGDVPAAFVDIKRAVLVRLAELPSSPAKGRDSGSPPHLGHGPVKVTLASVTESGYPGTGLLIGWRPAMHRSTDGPGYPPGLSLELLDVKAVIEPALHEVFLDQLTIIRVENLREFEALDSGLAWRIKVGWERSLYQANVPRKMILAASPGVGLATSPERDLQGFALVTAPVEVLGTQQAQAGLGSSVGTVLKIANYVSGRLELSLERLVTPSPVSRRTWSGDLEYHMAKDWSLAAQMEIANANHRYQLGLSWFF